MPPPATPDQVQTQASASTTATTQTTVTVNGVTIPRKELLPSQQGQTWRDAMYNASAAVGINATTIFGVGPQFAVNGWNNAAVFVADVALVPTLYSMYRATKASHDLAMSSVSSPELNAHNMRQMAFHTTVPLVHSILAGAAMYGIQYFAEKRGVDLDLGTPPPYVTIAENAGMLLFGLLGMVAVSWCAGKQDLYDALHPATQRASVATAAASAPNNMVTNPMLGAQRGNPNTPGHTAVEVKPTPPEAVRGRAGSFSGPDTATSAAVSRGGKEGFVPLSVDGHAAQQTHTGAPKSNAR